jgi:hypothetical protein
VNEDAWDADQFLHTGEKRAFLKPCRVAPVVGDQSREAEPK